MFTNLEYRERQRKRERRRQASEKKGGISLLKEQNENFAEAVRK